MDEQPPTSPTTALDRRLEAVCTALGVLMLALAFQVGTRATEGLTWGAYVDFDRDASFARSVQEGHYGEDPLYRGESLWFTPLIFTFEAYASRALGMDLHVFQARAGAYLNMLVPLAFWFMARRLFGPVVGVAALIAHVCLMQGQEPGWAVSTYSPWFLPMIFCQCLFYFSMPLLVRTFDSGSNRTCALMGAVAGILFLGHAAPAIILVVLIAVQVIGSVLGALREGNRRAAIRHMAHGAIAGSLFILVTLPLTWYVVGDYVLDQKNRVPSAFTYMPLSLRHGELFLFHNLNWVNMIALLGLVRLWRVPATTVVRLLRSWMLVSVCLLVYAYLAVALGEKSGIKLPQSVPAFHFYFYLKAVLAVGFGHGLWFLLERAVHPVRPSNASWTAPIHVGIVSSIFLAVFPTYANRSDIAVVRHRALERSANTAAADMRDRLVELVPWDAVVLCDEELTMEVLMASARKTVATASSMANPYVPPEPRMRARDELLSGLERAGTDIGVTLAAYDVAYLLVRTTDSVPASARLRWFPHEVYANAGYALYARQSTVPLP